jgi:hypothetical protein
LERLAVWAGVVLVLPMIGMAGRAAAQDRSSATSNPSTPGTGWVRDAGSRERDWREDIDFLASELPRRHKKAFFKCRRKDFDNAAAALREAVPRMSDHQVVVGLMKLTAMLGDNHTSIQLGGLSPAFHSFPIQAYMFSDGPVILAAREAQKDLIGCTLVKFSGVPIEEAFRCASTALAYENEPAFKSNAPRLLFVPEIAHAVGLIPAIDRASVVVRDAGGRERSVELTPLAAEERLTPVVFDEAKLPLPRRRNAHRNWFERIPESGTVYFRYNTCADEPDQTVWALSGRILDALDEDKAERLIVDLRGNSGGDSGLLEPFIWRLPLREKMQRPGGVVVLIGRNTFSSAYMHASSLKRMGATLIGEPTGQKPNAYGEVRWFTLPRCQIVVRYSTKYWHRETGDPPSLAPDVLIELTSGDFLAGKDPVFEAAMAYKAGTAGDESGG